MKEVKHYVCDICGTEYKEKQKCEECEKGHQKPEGIDSATWGPIHTNGSGYPTSVHIRMSNGKIITYKYYM